MTEASIKSITAAATEIARSRDERAQHVASIVRDRRAYRWVGIYDVADDEATLIASAGKGPSGERVSVPILGAESGIVIGTLDVEDDREDAFSIADQAFLDECANAMIGLFE